jgi:hypothetical protein
VETGPIVAKLDPARNVIHGSLPGCVRFPVHQFNLQRPVYRFRQCTMPFN